MASIVCVIFKCGGTVKRQFTTLQHQLTFLELCDKIHRDSGQNPNECKYHVQCGNGAELEDKCTWIDISDLNMTVGAICVGFLAKFVKITCIKKIVQETGIHVQVEHQVIRPNAFDLLMSGRRLQALPALKTSSSGLTGHQISRKDELFNDLVADFRRRGATFPKDVADTDGRYIVQILCNALWYITNQHITFSDVSSQTKEVISVPLPFQKYDGYNDIKRKKMKALPLSPKDLDMHSQVLYSLCTKPIMKTTVAWTQLQEDLLSLADCFQKYKKYLDDRASQQEALRQRKAPARQISKTCSVEYRCPASAVNDKVPSD